MKRSLILLIFSASTLLLGACNKHSWEGEDGETPTKRLFEEHGGHEDHAKGHKDGGDHKEDHTKKKKDADKSQP